MTCCDSDTPATPKRRRSFEKSTSENGLNLSEEPVLIPLLEDLAIWLSGFLSTEIAPENFIELFEDGSRFCKLATILHEKAVEYKERTQHSHPLPSYAIRKWYENPKIGSFFCRDNVCKFINWCKHFGVSEICLFESNDIVEHKSVRALRNVLICLLDVGKIGVKHGIEPSELVRIDLEIEQEIQAELMRVKNSAMPRKTRIPRKNSSLNSSLASSSEPASSEEEVEEEEEERPVSSPEPDEEELERIRLKLLTLDEQVRAIVSRCTCKNPFQLDRVGDGKYKLPHTSQIFFVRILRNHVMVRVGGGWDTLDHFIAKHDPCRMKFKQIVGALDTRDVKSKISTSWSSSEQRQPRRNRSISMVTSSPLAPAEQPWIREDVSPVAKQPRQQDSPSRFSRSSSARFVRRLSFSSESEDLGSLASRCAHTSGGGSEGGSTASSVPDFDFDTLEEKMNTTMSPLLSFNKMATIIVDEDEPLTLFNQTPKKQTSRAETPRRKTSTPRSKIPVPTARSKSCERKSNTVSNIPTLKHSKSGEVHKSNYVITPQRKMSTPIQPASLKQSAKQTERQLQKCMAKTPKSLLSNPTSATTRKVLKSKSSDNLQKHMVRPCEPPLQNTSLPAERFRRKSTDGSAMHKVSQKTIGGKSKPKGLTKSKSSEISRHNVVSLRKDEEVVMKPDLQNLNSSKSTGRSFVDWLKKRRNEN